VAIRQDALGEHLYSTTSLPSATAFTVAGWFKKRGTGNTNEFIVTLGSTDGTNGWIIFSCRDNGTVQFRLSVTGNSVVFSKSVTTDVWYFCVVSSDGSTVTARLAEAGETSFESQTRTYTSVTISDLRLGNSAQSANPALTASWANGAFAGWKVWDAALSEAECLLEMYSIRPQRFTNLNRWTPMHAQEEASSLADYSGNGRGWTAAEVVSQNSIEDGPPVSWGGRLILPMYAAVAGVPTLSLPGVQSITSTSAVPKVTLTY
jgi:hypothetical protein